MDPDSLTPEVMLVTAVLLEPPHLVMYNVQPPLLVRFLTTVVHSFSVGFITSGIFTGFLQMVFNVDFYLDSDKYLGLAIPGE